MPPSRKKPDNPAPETIRDIDAEAHVLRSTLIWARSNDIPIYELKVGTIEAKLAGSVIPPPVAPPADALGDGERDDEASEPTEDELNFGPKQAK